LLFIIMKNKKTLLYLCLISTQIFIADILFVQAQCGPNIGIPCNPIESKISTLSDAVIVVSLYLLSLIGLITLLFIIFAGAKYMFSAGDEEKMRSAKSALNSAIIGLALALLAYGILSVVNYLLNG